jgi:hypothetical protein
VPFEAASRDRSVVEAPPRFAGIPGAERRVRRGQRGDVRGPLRVGAPGALAVARLRRRDAFPPDAVDAGGRPDEREQQAEHERPPPPKELRREIGGRGGASGDR